MIYFNGQRIAKREPSGAVYYFFDDHLGNTRVATNATGGVVDDMDPYPHGGSRVISYTSNDPYLFTDKEYDPESYTHYFGARHYSISAGRFLQPDPLMASARISNPQTWNRYSYVLNNPLRWIDPDGMKEEDCKVQPCTVTVKVNVIYDKNANGGKGLSDEQKAKFEQKLLEQAKKDYGNSDIKLGVTYTAGALDKETGTITATLQEGSINVVATDRVPVVLASGGEAAVSGVYREGGKAFNVAVVGIDQDGDLSHELAHHFLGHPGTDRGFLDWRYYVGEASVGIRRTLQDLGVRQDDFREGGKKFSVPPDQKANEPRKE